ncbi:MAG: cardiolipin synthase [Planctomycetaceae bacterium]
MTASQVAFGMLSVVGYLLTLLLLPVVLLTKKQQPTSTVAWMLVIVTMPIFGAMLFLIFGINRVHRRLRSRQMVAAILNRTSPRVASHHQLASEPMLPLHRAMMQLSHKIAGTRPTVGNEVLLLTETSDAFREIESAIAAARSSIHLEYYIWQPDRIGTRVRDALIAKSKAGVKVRFLYDSLGSMRLTRRFLQSMRDAGIEVASFVPGQTFRERWSLNLRSHRKIIVVDGQVGFTGGMNIGDEYLGRDPHFGYWRDTHVRLVGPTVLQLQDVFALDWKYATGEDLTDSDLYPVPPSRGNVVAQVIAGGPDEEDGVFHRLLFSAINEARNHVVLTTCYFVPTPSLMSALENAALRGVRVRILVSGRVVYWYTHYAARSFYDSLLEAGAEVYEYERGQQHAKTLVIDGQWSFVGTPNFDTRSVFLNFEVGVAMYDAGIAEQLEADFDRAVQDAQRIDQAHWSRRGTWQKVRENFCRMFSPVL